MLSTVFDYCFPQLRRQVKTDIKINGENILLMIGTAAQMNVQMSQKLIILKQYINYVEMLKSRALVLQESCDLTDFKLVP